MNSNDPPESGNLQMTPVQFSPVSTPDSVGTIIGAPRQPFQFSYFIPVTIVLLTLNFGVVRDIVTLNKRMDQLARDEAPAMETLKKSGKQTEFLDSIEGSLKKLAPDDPVAAQIVTEYFPPPATPKPAGQDSSADKSPAK